jgi:chromosome segregation ATPase
MQKLSMNYTILSKKFKKNTTNIGAYFSSPPQPQETQQQQETNAGNINIFSVQQSQHHQEQHSASGLLDVYISQMVHLSTEANENINQKFKELQDEIQELNLRLQDVRNKCQDYLDEKEHYQGINDVLLNEKANFKKLIQEKDEIYQKLSESKADVGYELYKYQTKLDDLTSLNADLEKKLKDAEERIRELESN